MKKMDWRAKLDARAGQGGYVLYDDANKGRIVGQIFDRDAVAVATAAPDLLAACERVIDALKDHVLIAASLEGAQPQGREICSMLNAAIAKARGTP